MYVELRFPSFQFSVFSSSVGIRLETKHNHLGNAQFQYVLLFGHVFIVRMIETTSRDSFNHNHMKHVQNGGHVDRRRVPLRFKLRPTRDQMLS